MYLAKTHVRGLTRYILRESVLRQGRMVHRDLVDLGPDPGRFIVYPGGRAFYIDPGVESALQARGANYTCDDLDELFMPFLDPEIRWRLKWLIDRRTGRGKTPLQPASGPEGYFLFDRRRMHFLRCGAMDQGNIGRMPAKLLRVLDGKSRDEIEQVFLRMEAGQRAREHKPYVFVIFDLQRFFDQSYAKKYPEMLDAGDVDAFFLGELCRLNDDPDLWVGMGPADNLRDYLIRYLVMYFDAEWGHSRFLDDVLRSFIEGRRRYHPGSETSQGLAEAAGIFQESEQSLRAMNRDQIRRIFRIRAQQLHPDKGGTHEAFIQLARAYRALIKRAKSGGIHAS